MAENQTLSVSVLEPVGQALGRVKTILFKPFDIEKWFIIGFSAWLATLGQGGFNFHLPPNRSQIDEPLNRIGDVFQNNLPFIITAVSVGLIIGLALSILIYWLSSRGRFMFLSCVVRNLAEVKNPWHEFKRRSNSLFVFRIVASIIMFLCMAILIAPIVIFAVFIYKDSSHMLFSRIAAITLLSSLTILALIAFSLLFKFTTDFVVPIMYLQNISCTTAWRQFLKLLSTNKTNFFLYILVQILISIAVSTIVFIAVILTCCCAACFLIIPYIGTVILLPVLVFTRSYSLYYLRQYGPDFDVFSPQILTQTAPPPP